MFTPGPKRKWTPFARAKGRSEEHTSELQSRSDLVCRLLLEKKKKARRHPGRHGRGDVPAELRPGERGAVRAATAPRRAVRGGGRRVRRTTLGGVECGGEGS